MSEWIPKTNGGQRPLSIPIIKDRVVQTAVLLVKTPFLTPLCPHDSTVSEATSAIRRVYECLTRRISDGSVVLGIIRQWLRVPVMERTRPGIEIRTTVVLNTHRGIAQGSPISPLLGNLYLAFLTASLASVGLPRISAPMAYSSPIRFSASVVISAGIWARTS